MVPALVALALVTGSVSRAEGPPTEHGMEADMAGVWTPPTAVYALQLSDPGPGGARWTQPSGWTVWSDSTPAAGMTSAGAGERFGHAIVFSSTRPAADGSVDSEVYLRHDDGTLEQLTDNTDLLGEDGETEPINDLNPVLSPDGTKVAFDSAPAPAPEEEQSDEEEGGGGPDTSGSGPPDETGGSGQTGQGGGGQAGQGQAGQGQGNAGQAGQGQAGQGQGGGETAAGDEPAATEETAEQPATDEPAAEEPAAEEPAPDEAVPRTTAGQGGGGENGGRPPLSGQAATQIWILDLTKEPGEDGRLTQVTFSAASVGASYQPTWSPDGTKLAFTRGSGQGARIVVLDLVGGGETTVSTGRHFGHPYWSPTDPDLIAVTMGAGVMADVYVIDLTDRSLRPLATTDNLAEANPAFSPDGSRIAYQVGDDAIGAGISVIPAGGGDRQELTAPTLWSDRNPGWADDGTVVYESTKDARPAADLRVTLAGEPASLGVGGIVTYTVELTNAGPLTAPGATVVTRLPAGLVYVDATAEIPAPDHGDPGMGQGGNGGGGAPPEGAGEDEETAPPPTLSESGGVVTATFSELPKGDLLAVGGVVKILAKAEAAGTHEVTTSVAISGSTEVPDIYDPVGSNDTASVATTVTAPAAATPEPSTPTPTPTSGGSPAPVTAAVADETATTASVAEAPPVVVNGVTCTIAGTDGDDVLIGTARRDVICGLGGDDRIVGLGGNDLVFAGTGDDWVDGGAGNDWIDGGPGNDILNGGTGKDVEHGRAGNDTILHVAGFSRAYGGAGNDWIVSVDGTYDWLNGGAGRDTAHLDPKVDRTHSIEQAR